MRNSFLNILSILIFTLLPSVADAQSVTIRGKVMDEKRSPVELAHVRVEGMAAGATCDLKGKYQFTCESKDTMVVSFSMLGYETKKRTLYNPTDTVTINIMLNPAGIELGGVEVSTVRRQTNAMTDVNIKDMKHMGNASGGGVEQIIATQAGVSTHNELSSQYNVRGGSFDENSVYINGIEVYRPLLIRSGQQEGLSIINPDMIDKVSFSAGGFDARYGEKMSSVLDITYKKAKGFEGAVSASLLGASAYVGYGNDKFSMSHAFRYKTMKNLLGTLDTKGEYDPRDMDYQTYISWSPTKRTTFDVIGVISLNDYNFIPSTRSTSFGTSDKPINFKVYFDGKERDRFNTYFGAFSANHKFNQYNDLTFNLSAFKTTERETYDISGEYWIDNSENTSSNLAIGKYLEHARNRLNASVLNIGFTGHSRLGKHDMRYGALMKFEKVSETMREWEMRDSAGYSLPRRSDAVELIYNMTSMNEESSRHLELFAQDTYRKEYKEGEFVLNYGARLTHWSYNKETLFSPRATLAFVPAKNDNITIRFSTGLYYQTPFYKEMRDTTTVNGNTYAYMKSDIKSQRSVHFVLAGEYRFKIGNRPFKFTTEAYYKALSNLIPYNVDNVRVVYYGGNISSGYATGVDFKIYGEFVPGTDSWLSCGIMKTAEQIDGVWMPRPTDQRLNLALFFSDYFPGTTKWKVTLRGHYAGGLPFGPPHSGRERQVFRMPSYRRVDLGISYRVLDNEDRHVRNGIATNFKNIWLGVDVFNIYGINNVNSYYWVTDITGNRYAVPNYLTGRQINARMLFEF